MKCLIVDDEPLSRELMEGYLSDLPSLRLVASCKSAIEALEVLRAEEVDLIFLDINMPKLSGIEFYKSLSHPPKVVFTTAYPDFAVEGFELDAVDYLLKPFSFERFVKAVNKAAQFLQSKPSSVGFVMLKADKRVHKVDMVDILFVESIGDYMKVHLKDGRVLIVSETMKRLEEALPTDTFLRVHKSYLISLEHVDFIEGNRVKVADQMVPVGETYRTKLTEVIPKRLG